MGASCSTCKCDETGNTRRGRKRPLPGLEPPIGHEPAHQSYGSGSKPNPAEYQAAIKDRLGSLRNEAGRLEQVARGLQQSLQPPETETLSAENAALRAELQNISAALQQQQHAGQEQVEFLRSQLRLRESENAVLRKRMVSTASQGNRTDREIMEQHAAQQSLPFIEAPGYLKGYSPETGSTSHDRFNLESILAFERAQADPAGMTSNHVAPSWEYERQLGTLQSLPTELGTANSLPPVTPVPSMPWHGHSGNGTSQTTGVAPALSPGPWALGPASMSTPQVQPSQHAVEPISENEKPLFNGYIQSLLNPNQSPPEERYDPILATNHLHGSMNLNGSLLAEMLGPARSEWLQEQKHA